MGRKSEIGMDEQQIQYEPISPEREREGWGAFLLFHAATVNAKYGIENRVPIPASAKSAGSDSPVAAQEPDEEETDSPDEDDKVTFKRLDKSKAYYRAVISVLTNSTLRAAAKQIGISVRQLGRWRNDPEFQELLEKTRKEIYSTATTAMKTQLTKSGLNAVRTLQTISEDPKAADTARVQAAAKLAAFVLQVQEIENIESRLQELEKVGKAVADTGTFTKIKKD
jgi:hypothetical protein